MGVVALTFYLVLFAAGGNDVLATYLHVSENAIIWTMRVLLLGLPLITGFIAHRLCCELASSHAGKGRPPNFIVRTPSGGYSGHLAAPLAADAPASRRRRCSHQR